MLHKPSMVTIKHTVKYHYIRIDKRDRSDIHRAGVIGKIYPHLVIIIQRILKIFNLHQERIVIGL